MNIHPPPHNTRRRQTSTPLESFGPEIMAALLRGGREELKLATTYRLGSVFRRRVHQLRARLREINHPEYPIAARTKVQLMWGKRAGLPPVDETRNRNGVTRPIDPDAPALLILSPRDSEFTDILSQAGVHTDLTADPLASIEGELMDPLSSFRPHTTPKDNTE